MLWNVHELVLTKQQKFLENIQKDQMGNQLMMTQLLAGHTRINIRNNIKQKFVFSK